MSKPSLLTEYREEMAKDAASRDKAKATLHTGRLSTMAERLAAAAEEIERKVAQPKRKTPRQHGTVIRDASGKIVKTVYPAATRPEGYGQSLKRAKHAGVGNSTNLESALAVEGFAENDARTDGFYGRVTELLKVTVNPDPQMIGTLRMECVSLGKACQARGFIREAVLLQRTEEHLRDAQYVNGARRPADRSKAR